MDGRDRQLPRPRGSLQVKGPRGARRYYALWTDADGRHQRLLGPAWVKATERRTPRGAVVWRAADGPKPSPAHLTPEDAQDRLGDLLAAAPRRVRASAAQTAADVKTFHDACEEFLRYVEHERQRRPSTVRDYRNMVRASLLPRFGAETPLQRRRGGAWVDTITTEAVEQYRAQLLASHLADRTAQKMLATLFGVLKRAKRKGWIDANPAADAERVAIAHRDDFSILVPIEFEAVVRTTGDVRIVALLSTAFYAGLRFGELRELRWGDVDFAGSVIRVRAGSSLGQRTTTKGKRVRAVPLVDVLAERLEAWSRQAAFAAEDDYVFAGALDRRLTGDEARSVFYDALAAAGLGDRRERIDKHGEEQKAIVFHDLRHSYCSWAVNAYTVPEVREFAGHRDISTTMKYVHVMTKLEHARRGSDALARMLAPLDDISRPAEALR